MLDFSGATKGKKVKTFQFQAAWAAHKDFESLVNKVWNNNLTDCFNDKLDKIRETLYNWSKQAIGDLEKRKRRTLARLDGIQRIIGHNWKGGLIKLESKLRKEMDEIRSTTMPSLKSGKQVQKLLPFVTWMVIGLKVKIRWPKWSTRTS